MDIKLTDLTENHTGKWYEVCTYSTCDKDEKPEVVAKFKSLYYAKFFANNLVNIAGGITEVLIR